MQHARAAEVAVLHLTAPLNTLGFAPRQGRRDASQNTSMGPGTKCQTCGDFAEWSFVAFALGPRPACLP